MQREPHLFQMIFYEYVHIRTHMYTIKLKCTQCMYTYVVQSVYVNINTVKNRESLNAIGILNCIYLCVHYSFKIRVSFYIYCLTDSPGGGYAL